MTPLALARGHDQPDGVADRGDRERRARLDGCGGAVPPEASLADDLVPRSRSSRWQLSVSWTRRSVNGVPSIQAPALPPDGVARSRSWYVPGFMFLLAPVRPVAVANGLYLPHLPLVC